MEKNRTRTSVFESGISLTDYPSDHAFNGLDLMKLIAAYLVLSVHSIDLDTFPAQFPFYTILYLFRNGLCRVAVPLFFMSSGFLLFRKIDPLAVDGERIKQYCFRILRLLGTWTVILLYTSTIHLWYMGALVIAVLLIAFLMRKKVGFGAMLAIAGVLYAIGLLGDSYSGIIAPLRQIPVLRLGLILYDVFFQTTRNGVFFGFLYVLLGALFAQKRIVLPKPVVIVGTAVSLLFLIAEAYLLKRYSQPKDYNMYAALVPAVFFVFYLFSHLQTKDRPIYRRLRTVGTLVYFTHTFVLFFVGYAYEIAMNKLSLSLQGWRYPAVVVITTALAILIARLSENEKLKWLRWLYS